MNTCEILKHHLIKHGRESVEQHELLYKHLGECEVCRRLLHSWTRVPALLDELPEHEPDDILLRRTRNAIAQGNKRPRLAARRAPRLATSLATAAVLLAAIGISRQLLDQEFPSPISPAFKEEYELVNGPFQKSPQRSAGHGDKPSSAEPADVFASNGQIADEANRISGGYAGSDLDMVGREEIPGSRKGQLAALPEEEKQRFDDRQQPAVQSPNATANTGGKNDDPARKNEGLLSKDKLGELRSRSETRDDESMKESFYRDKESKKTREVDGELAQSRISEDNKTSNKRSAPKTSFKASPATEFSGGLDLSGFEQTTEQLHFQPADGYWTNTHVPGDPAIRLLKARLAQWDRSGLPQLAGLEQSVRPVSQPFDAPADNALALSVMSDANAVDGATRMRLQIGIRGIEHRRGQRPAMNMGLVIDLPADADDDTRIATRALLDAVLASKQPGDRFSLVINGPEGLVVAPEDFRFGPLQLARQAIAGGTGANAGQSSDLGHAIARANELVRQTDDPSLPLGSSSILLISAGSLGNIDQLTTQIHAQAVEGITLSVVPLGNRPDNSQLEQLVLAGLGQRRILEAPDKARQLIESELYASSRAVARAARLSIRLAPGVRLVDVVGSERLDDENSQRVRDIENSMDSRLSKNFGIEADRGEDEGGIQIVIPSIFSGDDVTVLLDVVATQPGDIASVSLRYKDLVYLRNGKLSGQLSLPAGALERGPEQYAVIKNLVANHFSTAAARAADALGRQQAIDAVAILARMRDEIIGLRARVPAFKNDPDLLRDLQILESYIEVLGSSGAQQPELADSLRYAAWAKSHRPPAEWKQ